jgi:hypothetical protein
MTWLVYYGTPGQRGVGLDKDRGILCGVGLLAVTARYLCSATLNSLMKESVKDQPK